MFALNFDVRRPRPIIRGRHRYVLTRMESGKFVLIDAACRHRGGPLDLGDLVADGVDTFVRCPWHQRCERLDRLYRRSLPLIIRDGSLGTAIVPD
jgi:nitrite reductase/ring-hydroxylating ferredoxin subunit